MNDQNRGQHQPMRQNEVVSAEGKLTEVLRVLEARGEELSSVLPRDVTLDAFLSNVNQAFRANPKLLRCTFASIVDACVKAAYDGLRIDGKEAAIVDAIERYKDGNAWKERTVARYMPMVFGLIKQILKAGAALTVKAVVVYRNEARNGRFTLLEGTTPGIHHEPFVEGEEKGDMIGAYAIAEVKPGIFKFEWMDAAAILDVRKESKTDKVWDRWPTEMWKKTAVRRLRKSLSGTSEIHDSEAAQMFPHFDRSAPHPQLAAAAPPRPTRQMLSHQGGESGVPLDLGSNDERVVDHEPAEREQRRQDAPREQQRAAEPQEERVDLPEDAVAWAKWGTDIESKISAAKTVAAVDSVWAGAQPVLKHASKEISDRLIAKVTARNTDLALEASEAGDGATE